VPSASEVDAGLAMPLAEAMSTQRAIRRLRSDPVDDDVVLRCIELATRAPTGSNRQGWEFVVVRDPEVKHQLARLNRQAWSVYRRLGSKQARRDPSTRKIVDAVQWQADHFEEVPVVVVPCIHGRAPVFGSPVMAASYYASIFPAVQNLLLAARAVGLGATLTTFPLWSATLARRTLGLPGTVSPVAVVPLGWPLGRYGPTTRRPVEEVVHLDRYGNQPFSRTASAAAPAGAE
jgi:nitroreductase